KRTCSPLRTVIELGSNLMTFSLPSSNITTRMSRAGFFGSPGSPAEKCAWSSCARPGPGKPIPIANDAAARRAVTAAQTLFLIIDSSPAAMSFGSMISLGRAFACRLHHGRSVRRARGIAAARRLGRLALELVRDSALRVLVVAGVLVIVWREPLADLHQREHA